MCVEIMDPNADAAAAAAAAVAPDEDEDADVQYAGRTGDIALSDFPHSRENCLESLWKPGNEKHACPNCYCFVCDKPVSECPEWDEHCMAKNTQQVDLDARALEAARLASAAPGRGERVGGGASSSSRLHRRPPSAGAKLTSEERKRWDVHKILAREMQVFPIEASEPNHFNKNEKLKPYQRQSLAVSCSRSSRRRI